MAVPNAVLRPWTPNANAALPAKAVGPHTNKASPTNGRRRKPGKPAAKAVKIPADGTIGPKRGVKIFLII